MAFPPALPPTGRTDTTPAAGAHAADHNTTAVALASLVDEVTAVDARLAFDVTKIRPTYMTSLQLQRASVMQHAIKDPTSGDFYVTQATTGTTGTRETCTISRVSAAGVLLDYMELTDGGHGTAIALQRVNGKVNLWLAYQAAPTAAAVTPGAGGNDLLRFEYKASTTPVTRDSIVATVMPKFGGAYVIVAIDEANDVIAYRVSSGTSDVYVRRHLSEVLAGVDRTYGTVTLTQGALPDGSTITMQGFATIDGSLYRYSGNTNGSLDPARITRYAWDTGTVTGVVDTSSLGVLPDGTTPAGFREPEGIALYRDPASGLPHLTAGVTTGPTNRRGYSLFLFAPVGGDQHRGAQLQALEGIAPVDKSFKARRMDPANTALHNLTTPGWYYLTAAEFATMTDRPTDAPTTSGHWLEVGGIDSNTGQTQTLHRNTTANTPQRWFRVIDQTTGTAGSVWSRVPDAATIEAALPTQLSKGGRRMPAGTTTYRALNVPGWYYLTAAEAATFTDKPTDAPTTSGYILEVTGYDTSTGYAQRLIRSSTAAGAWTWYRMCASDGSTGAWVRSADGTATAAAITQLQQTTPTLDELTQTVILQTWGSGTPSNVEAASNTHTIWLPPFACQIVAASVSWEYWSFPATSDTDYWGFDLTRNRAGVNAVIVDQNTKLTGGKAVVSRSSNGPVWDYNAAVWNAANGTLAPGDRLLWRSNKVGAPASHTLPATITFRYVPV